MPSSREAKKGQNELNNDKRRLYRTLNRRTQIHGGRWVPGIVREPNGITVHLLEDGQATLVHPDGTTLHLSPATGDAVRITPDGVRRRSLIRDNRPPSALGSAAIAVAQMTGISMQQQQIQQMPPPHMPHQQLAHQQLPPQQLPPQQLPTQQPPTQQLPTQLPISSGGLSLPHSAPTLAPMALAALPQSQAVAAAAGALAAAQSIVPSLVASSPPLAAALSAWAAAPGPSAPLPPGPLPGAAALASAGLHSAAQELVSQQHVPLPLPAQPSGGALLPSLATLVALPASSLDPAAAALPSATVPASPSALAATSAPAAAPSAAQASSDQMAGLQMLIDMASRQPALTG